MYGLYATRSAKKHKKLHRAINGDYQALDFSSRISTKKI